MAICWYYFLNASMQGSWFNVSAPWIETYTGKNRIEIVKKNSCFCIF